MGSNGKGGFVKLYRSMLGWEWYDDPNTFRVFVHILLRANYEDKRWHGIEIKRGQLLTSRSKLAKETRLSTQSVRTALLHLKSTGEITIESTKRATLITVANFGLYQSGGEKVTNEITNQITNESQTNHKRITNESQQIKKDKNIRNKESKNFIKESKEKVGGSGAFATAWYNPPDPLTEEETSQLLNSAHEQFAPIKAALMKEAVNG